MSVLVTTRYGRVRSALDRGVHAFRNLPYAATPRGSLRFQPPHPVKPWTGVREGREFGPAAPQNAPRMPSLYPERAAEQSEACLSLNVWTPALDGLPQPVVVWLHPGGFVEGSASEPGHDGRAIARRGGLVFVSVQVRLGLLGWADFSRVSGDERLSHSNLALQDAVAALEWIRDEIDAFGGDPYNVTVVGSSSGANLAAALLVCPRARGLFHRAVLQSGTYRYARPETADRLASAVLDELGLAPERAGEILEVPVARLLGVQARAIARLGHEDPAPIRPVVGDSWLPAAPLDAIAAGTAAPLPVIVGCNRNEARIFAATDPGLERLDVGALARRLEADLPRERIGEAIDLYRKAAPEASPSELWFAIQTDLRFRVPAARLAAAHGQHVSQTYAYLFAFPAATQGGRLGAFHGLEIPFVLGTRRRHPLGAFVGRSTAAKSLSRRIRDAWSAFADTADPRHPELGFWLPYTEADHPTLLLTPDPHLEPGALEQDTFLFG